MDPAMLSVANMFGSESGDEEDDAFVERDHRFPGMVLRIREFRFHQVNGNLLWPGATIFAEWILEHKVLIRVRRVLELGSGSGALSNFLKKTCELDITTSDYDDVEIENNISKNCDLNWLATLPHIRPGSLSPGLINFHRQSLRFSVLEVIIHTDRQERKFTWDNLECTCRCLELFI